jgi:hypothetical protein
MHCLHSVELPKLMSTLVDFNWRSGDWRRMML